MTKELLQKRLKKIEMMISAHAVLKERFILYSKILNYATLSGSAVILTTVLMDPKAFSFLNVNHESIKLVIAIFSLLIFIMTLFTMKMNYEEKAFAHQNDFNSLTSLKFKFQKALDSNPQNESNMEKVYDDYDTICSGLTGIPDSLFTKLKAKHKCKVEISKMIDNHPGVPIIFLKIKLLWRSLFGNSDNCKKIRETSKNEVDMSSEKEATSLVSRCEEKNN